MGDWLSFCALRGSCMEDEIDLALNLPSPYIKPVDEIPALYKKTFLDLSGKPLSDDRIKVPEHYLLDCELKVAPKTVVSFDLGGMYRMTLDTANGRMMLEGEQFDGADGACPVDVTKPVKIQIFTEGNLIECFVNDQFAKSCLVKKPLAEYLKISAKAGKAQALKLKVKTTQ